ncbi:MAG: aminoglycoside adenylyltransferase domain-containing protein [Dehalococcoidia bacterium]
MGFTPVPELDTVLADLTARVAEVLQDNLVGVYLVGSFSQGDGNASSDCDFMVVIRADLSGPTVERLNAVHAAVYGRPDVWAQHLEGSYVPAGVWRDLASAPVEPPEGPRPADWLDPAVGGGRATAYPLWYLNNGAASLIRSQHDNTLVTRWVFREHGVPIAGPPAETLVDPIDPEALRAEIGALAMRFGRDLASEAIPLTALWLQGFTVLFYCRVLLSLETASVPSKPVAMRWAMENLDRKWHPLIQRAWANRGRQARGVGAPEQNAALTPDPADAIATVEFVRYALAYAGIDP